MPNTDTSDDLLKQATHPDRWVRIRAAENAAAPDSILELLSPDVDAGIRCAVARNRRTPMDVLGRLAEDVDQAVRARLAENTDSGELLAMLSCDQDREVRSSVAANPTTPPDVLARMVDDDYERRD